MRIRWASTALLPILAGTALAAPSAAAATPAAPTDSSCTSETCVWTGANYTGTKWDVRIPGLNRCFTAPGGTDVRSAQVTGMYIYLTVYANADCTGAQSTLLYASQPSFDPPMHGMKAFLNKF